MRFGFQLKYLLLIIQRYRQSILTIYKHSILPKNIVERFTVLICLKRGITRCERVEYGHKIWRTRCLSALHLKIMIICKDIQPTANWVHDQSFFYVVQIPETIFEFGTEKCRRSSYHHLPSTVLMHCWAKI